MVGHHRRRHTPVSLTPTDAQPKLHAQPLLDGVMANPELMNYIGIAKPWTTLDDVCQWQESVGRANPVSLVESSRVEHN